MKFLSRRAGAVAVAVALAVPLSACNASAGSSSTAGLPKGKLTFVIPYAPGGSTDTFGRLFAEDLGKQLGRSIEIENVDGAGATVGIAQIVTSKNDGSVVGMGTNTALTLQPLVNSQLPWKTTADYTLFDGMMDSPTILVTGKKAGFTDAKDLLAKAKASPGKISIATTGANTLAHITLTQLEQSAGVKFNIVHFPSASEAIAAVLGGHVDGFSTTPSSAKGDIDSGDMVPQIVLSGGDKVPSLPDVPTMTDLGLEPTISFGLYFMAPKDLPASVEKKYQAAAEKVLEDPQYIKATKNQGAVVGTLGEDNSKDALRKEQEDMKGLVPLLK